MLEGLDITTLEEGKGLLTTEHMKAKDVDEKTGKLIGFETYVGSVRYAKKIFEEKDCDNDRQRLLWSMVKVPFLYIVAELFDDEGQPNAVALSHMIKYYHKRSLPLVVGFSIEGDTLEKTPGGIIKASIARAVACTIRPCNAAAIAAVYHGEKTGKELNKVEQPLYAEYKEEDLNKSEELEKTFTAGFTGGTSPGSLIGGAALSPENLLGRKKTIKEKIEKTLQDWDGVSDIKPILKAQMPEASDEFLEHFANLVDKFHIKKHKRLSKSVDDLQKATENLKRMENVRKNTEMVTTLAKIIGLARVIKNSG